MAELIERLRETIEKEQKEVGNQVFEMEVRAFNREENFRMLLSNTVDPLQKEQLLDRLGYLYDPFVSYSVLSSGRSYADKAGNRGCGFLYTAIRAA